MQDTYKTTHLRPLQRARSARPCRLIGPAWRYNICCCPTCAPASAPSGGDAPPSRGAARPGRDAPAFIHLAAHVHRERCASPCPSMPRPGPALPIEGSSPGQRAGVSLSLPTAARQIGQAPRCNLCCLHTRSPSMKRPGRAKDGIEINEQLKQRIIKGKSPAMHAPARSPSAAKINDLIRD